MSITGKTPVLSGQGRDIRMLSVVYAMEARICENAPVPVA
jgi:hypothetical protein